MSRSSRSSLTVVTVLAGALFLAACQRDRTAPTVSLITPAANTVTMGHIPIQARAFDNKDVPIVEFYVGGAFKGVDSLGSDSVYSFVWDATAEAMGSQHQLTAKAIDLAGNSATSQAVTVTIGIPSGPTNHRGSIPYPETWDPAGNPHIITGNLTANSFLTLKPGVEIRVDPGCYFKIGAAGGLLARGTAGSGILMTSNAATPAPGDWEGLEVGAGVNGDSVVLEYCTFEYGGKDTTDAVVELRGSPATISHCTIRNGPGYGLWLPGNNVKSIEATTITANYRHALRIDTRYAHFIADGNNFAGNGRGGVELFGGTIDADAQWFDPLAPYVLTADLRLGGTTPKVLTVKSGVTIRFRPGTGITVARDSSHFGGFVVEGAPSLPVTLTSDSSFPHPGDWKGITYGYLAQPDQARLANCVIEYAGGSGAAVVCDSARARITDCTIRYSSGYGVKVSRTGFAQFEGNTVGLNLSYPVAIDPDYVSSVGDNQLDQGLFVFGGTVTKSALWDERTYPVVVGGDVAVGGPANPVLRLDNLQLHFASTGGLRVGTVAAGPGGLNCIGTRFTGVSQQPGAWKGIEFRELTINDSSWIMSSRVINGGGDSLGNIVCIGSAPGIIDDSIVNSAAWGIYLFNSPLNPDSLRLRNLFGGNVSGDVGP